MPETAPATVLVIEEDFQLLQLIGKILEGAGYRVLQARTKRQAMKFLQADLSQIDLIIFDSLQAAGQLRSDIKVLVLSPGPMTCAVKGVLSKPFRPSDLVEAVRESLR